jgi:hypothetical protein
METIIGLGNAGCNIAKAFSEHPQYDVYGIDSEYHQMSNFKQISKCKSHEEYEAQCPDLTYFFKEAKPPYLFVLGGAGTISGVSLRVLEQLGSKDVYILFVKPDISLLTEVGRMQEKIVFQILQQFARSAMFKRLFIVHNSKLRDIIKNVPVVGYYKKLNELIVSTIHMINIFDNTKPEIDTFSDSISTARISTFGLVDLENGDEKTFYDLEMCREKRLYYSIKKRQLAEDGELLSKINDIKASYGIYSNEYEQNYVYSLSHSTLIQEQVLTD